jgi:hypothetical protein
MSLEVRLQQDLAVLGVERLDCRGNYHALTGRSRHKKALLERRVAKIIGAGIAT